MEHVNEKRRITPLQWFSWALMVAAPFLMMGLLSLFTGQNVWNSWPVWSNELDCYWVLQNMGIDRDKASYLLPQGLRKTFVMSGNLDDWQYVIKTRLCNRNTKEVQYIMRLIYNAIKTECGEEYVVGMLPSCVDGDCREGKFCCGEKFKL